MNLRTRLAASAALVLALAAVPAVMAETASTTKADDAAAWSMEADCESCHGDKWAIAEETDTAEKADDAKASTATSDKAEKPGDAADTAEKPSAAAATVVEGSPTHDTLGCTLCHSDEQGMTRAHKRATPEKAEKATRLKKSDIDQTTCETCHDISGLEVDPIVDSAGTAVDPHNLPENDGHGDITCGDCHKLHQPDADPATDAYSACVSCHHAEVFECGTCH